MKILENYNADIIISEDTIDKHLNSKFGKPRKIWKLKFAI